MEPIRIQKFLSESGVCSRRAGERMLAEGRIKINGSVVTTPGTKIDPDVDRVEVDGKAIKMEERVLIVAMMHKPAGYICTENDPQGRKTVHELLPEDMPRVFSVGRLDWASEGLLLFTNDGELSNALMHPSSGVLREYEVKVKGHPTRRAVQQLSKGYKDENGHQVVPMDVSFLRRTQKNSWYRIILTEGKYHEVRRICQAAEMTVLRLVRVAYGPIELNRLPEGEVRVLSGSEAHELRELANMKKKRRILSAADELGPPKAPK